VSEIKNNIIEIKKNIKAASESSGRFENVTLIGVTKTINIDRIQEMIDCGITELGENRVQELTEKHAPLSHNKINWHMIGGLQKNKVKFLPGRVCLIHSVDDYGLAAEIDKTFGKHNLTADILIEINIAGEETKHGIKPSACREFIDKLSEFANINARGLMTIAPYVQNPEETRDYFKKMYELFVDIREKCDNVVRDSFNVLSMGMTNDYRIAVEEGSTMVRIGTGIFGSRQNNYQGG